MTYEITLNWLIEYDGKPFVTKRETRTLTKARAAKAVYKRLTREIVDTFDLEANNGASYLWGSVEVDLYNGEETALVCSFNDTRVLSLFETEVSDDES